MYKKSPPCVEGVIMVFLNQISFKYYENLGIYYILYYLDIHQKELKSIQPLFLNPGAWLLFVGRSKSTKSIKDAIQDREEVVTLN